MSDAGSLLTTTLAGVVLRNPIILAAGTCGTLDEMAAVLDLSRVGAIVTKSVTPLPREGNDTWRILECRGGMLNAIGLANGGLDHFMEHLAPRVAGVPTKVIGSVAGFSVEDYVMVAAHLDEVESLAAIELNVSCPNVRGGVEFGLDPGALRELIPAVRPVVKRRPLFVKLSPIAAGHPSMVEVARAAIDPAGRGPSSELRATGRPGADALVIANTVPAMAIDVRTRRPRLANVTGGLSGPAVHPIAVRLVHNVYQGVAKEAGVPIVGVGGVMTWEDAAEFVLAGATAVQIGTALFADPRSPLAVAKGLARWVRQQGAANIGELVGKVEIPARPS
ncbi:MAG: dihydroorotate dehydrogenase [Phycisphaerales bacterium]